MEAEDRKRPFEGDDYSPSLSFQPCAKAARLQHSSVKHEEENSQRDDDNSAHANAGATDVISLLDDDDDDDDKVVPSNTCSLTSDDINNHQSDGDDDDDDEVVFVKQTRKKRVHFSEIEHEVFYFKRHISEQQSPSLSNIDEDASINNSSAIRMSSASSAGHGSRATADYTILSSHHGRARRQLRSISKHDLKAAVKYGQRFPGHPGRNGEPRWKIVHNGLVYITDHTMRNEITSYREDITIEPYPISLSMEKHHIELKRILKEEPYICTGHTYIIVDQSGSMRESDVDGFRTRSHAAWLTLCLEFIAEQLSSRPNQDDLFAESVTVIEMREEGQATFERVPFDWILFNRLLKIPNLKRPSSHGCYNPSLNMASEMIHREYNDLLKDGADQFELPNFSLVFLSDGKPSDMQPGIDRKERITILQSLAETLKDKFSLFCLGIGKIEAEFEQLQVMADIVQDHGGNGQFIHAGVSAVKLSQTFEAISSTLTSHRTTLLGDSNISLANNNNDNAKQSSEKVAKDVQMRETGKIVGKKFPSEKFCTRKGYTITRHRFDKDKSKSNPWKEMSLATHGANGVEIEIKPFGRGSERLAYRFHEINSDSSGDKRIGRMMVAKDSVNVNENETKDSFHKEFCLAQSTAYDLAELFNTAVRNAPLLKSVSEHTRQPELKFMLPTVYTIKNGKGEEKAYLVERMMQGKFVKFNSNNGYVRGANKCRSHSNIELQCGVVELEEFVQAFSHWCYEHTNHCLIVCDLQGVLNEEGRYPEFMLTDPAICTRKGERFGKTDMRLNGIRKFCTSHRCGNICMGLGLPCLNKLDK